MANEAEIINNPDSTPGAVSTGYQLQNTNLVSQRAGLDLSYVSGSGGTAVVAISGPVDVNGVLYNIKTQTVLTPPSAGRYYISLQGAGPQYLTPALIASAGTFNALKNARYDSSGYRVLNWVIYFDGTTVYVDRLYNPAFEQIIIHNAIIDILDIGVINMYAYGYVEIFSWTSVHGGSSAEFDILKPIYLTATLAGNPLGSSFYAFPGTYRLTKVDAGSAPKLQRKLGSVYEDVKTDIGGTILQEIKLYCIYAEGCSSLDDISVIIST